MMDGISFSSWYFSQGIFKARMECLSAGGKISSVVISITFFEFALAEMCNFSFILTAGKIAIGA